MFASNFEFWIGEWITVVDIPIQILLTILIPINHSSRSKLTVCIITHIKEKPFWHRLTFIAKLVGQWKLKEWAKFEVECLLLIFSHSNSKPTLKSLFKRWTYTKEKPLKFFAILPFFKKKILNLNSHPKYFGIYYSCWNHQICASKWFILT